ncbi:MAG: PAS domain S-box protein, partial [Actinomycetota bacterium]|nr:PAS domain S-box protein [Actinomycetota bacterium]
MDGYFKRLNPAWTQLLGYSIEELTSRPFNDFVHPDDRDKTAAEVGGLGTGAVTYTFENRYRCKDGSYRWLMWNSQPQVETGLIYAVAHDVTDQKKAGEASAKLAAIVQSSNDAILAWSSDGYLTSWNPGAERMYGYPAGDMIGRPVGEALKPLMPGDRPRDFENLLSRLEQGEEVSNFETIAARFTRPDTIRIHRDGQPLDVSLTMSLLRDKGVIIGGSMTARNETQRKAAQRERDAHNAMLKAVIANSQSAVYVKDLDGRYILANESFERAFGVHEEDLLGKTDLYRIPTSRPCGRANDLRAQKGAYQLDEWSDAADGRHFYESVKFPLYDAQGRLYATCGISLDVTERQRAADALIGARDATVAATTAKSSFLATMSHEIRTPMNAVIGMTGLPLDTSLDDEQRDFVGTVRDSGEALLAIINDVLDFSKIEAGQLELEHESFDLRACVEGSLDLLAPVAATKGIGLVCYVDENRNHVIGDVTRMRQVLINLLGNAIKFTEQGDV